MFYFKKGLLFIFCTTLIQAIVYSQEQHSILNSGFDTTQYHPLFIKSTDDKFLLNLGLYTQFRYNLNLRQDVPDTAVGMINGYDLARTRIFLEGDYTSQLHYHFRININTDNKMELMVAFLQWNLKKDMNIRMGKQFMALGREDWMYPCDLAAMEFSATDFTYAIWSSFGFQFHHKVSDKFRYWASVGNGVYGARQSFPSGQGTDITLTSRVEFQPVGTWGLWNDMTGRKNRAFGVLVGLGGGFTTFSDDILVDGDLENGNQINADLSINGNGYHFFSQYVFTGRNFKGDLEHRYGSAFYSTFGFWVSEHWFPFARLDYVGQGNYVGAGENYISPGLGVSYYPFNWTNRIRFTLEYNYLSATLANTYVATDAQLGLVESSYGGQQSLRFQVQFGF